MSLTAHRFTVAEYHRMGEAGVFHEDDRVELIDGQVVEMTPIGPGHGSCVNRLTELFAPLVGRATLSVQNPLGLGEHQEPQPDFAVLRYRPDGYRAQHPQSADVLLVIEVGDRSANSDRNTKIPLYALAGIPEAWLVNLPGDGIETYRRPVGGRYADVETVRRGGTLAPLAFPSLQSSADRILG
jgi:Uma2 family endonuclease